MREILLTLAAFALAAPAHARTWTVGAPPADFAVLAEAVATAAPGDVIRVGSGVYHGDLVLDKTLAIIGEGEARLVGTGRGTVITIHAGGSEVRGLTIERSGTGLTNAMDAAIHVMSDGNHIVGNRMRHVFYGVVVANATGNEIAGNEIDGLSDRPFGQRGDGIYLYRAPENTVSRNRIRDQRDAIYLQYAPRCHVRDNVVSDARYGLHDMFSDDTTIAGNTFTGSSAGANIMNSRRITLAGNQFLQNRGASGVGLTLKDSDGSTIRGNRIAGNPRGLLLDGSSSNQFVDNEFVANDTAVRLFSSAERNVFTGNQFVDNWSDLVLSGTSPSTRWSANGRGNYWSRYRGFDFDGDGIGDAPHAPLGAFEKLEGANPAARIYLRSPAATGLEMAARLGALAGAATQDDRPLVLRAEPGHGGGNRLAHPLAAAAWLTMLAAAAVVLIRGTNPC